jgi:N-methylhydantoinase B/oxoprolinase/acetone carboxylase alpha subunit
MVKPSGDLEARVAALEGAMRELAERVQRSEQDAAVARVLAGGADRDVEQIRREIREFRHAKTSSFNALREDLVDLRTHVDTRFTEMRGKLEAVATEQQQLVDLLTTLIGRQGDEPPGDTDRWLAAAV